MAKLFKRGLYWHYDFRFQRQRYQGSTFLKNKEKAESFVASLRTNLAMGLAGLADRKPAPVLSAFLEKEFLQWTEQHAKKPRTKAFYADKVKRLVEYKPFTMTRVDGITELMIQGYKDFRISQKLSPATINGELRTLRKALIYAARCELAGYQRGKVSQLPGEKNRDFILDQKTEKRFLELADYPLKQAAILMLDLGLRPEEVVGLRKADISPDVVIVRSGKTESARRALPQTHRTKSVFELCFATFPDSEWVFPGSKGQHFTRGALDNLYTAFRNEHGFPERMVLYSCRHTFATRLAESCNGDLFVLKEALGHADTKTCQKYVHVQPNYLTLAMKRKEAFDRILRGESDSVTTEITTDAKKERN